MTKPLCVDLFCGLGGWTKGFLSEGYECIGFDIERRPYPGQLVLQDVLTLDGSQFRRAACIVASPPCQAYSYRAMPWKRAKALPPPSNELFDACFRIQREASEAAGHHVPLVVENVCGAQKWVGRARWHFGSYYLWGDVPALMPFTASGLKLPGNNTAIRWEDRPIQRLKDAIKPTGVKVPGLNWSGSDKPGYVARAFNTTAEQRALGVKTVGHANKRDGYDHARHLANQRESDAIKDDWNRYDQPGRDCRPDGLKGLDGRSWIRDKSKDPRKSHDTNSPSRKAASALIAEIPFDLAQWIARCFKPEPQPAVDRFPIVPETLEDSNSRTPVRGYTS